MQDGANAASESTEGVEGESNLPPVSQPPASEAPVSEAPATSRRSIGPPTTFIRVLDDEQLATVQSGVSPQLIAALVGAEMDVHIRDGSVVAYWGGMAVMTLGQHPKLGYVAMIPRKVAEKCELPERAGVKGQLACYRVEEDLLSAVNERLAQIKELVEAADTRGGPMYHKFMRSNPGTSGVLPLDRQVHLPGLRSKLGGVGVEREGEQRFLLVDLRYGSGADVSKAPISSESFYRAVTDEAGNLNEEIGSEYRRMLEQRVSLGLPSLPVDTVQVGMPVASLIALAHCRSETVRERLHDAAEKARFPLFLCEFPGSDARIPKQSLWKELAKRP